MKRFALAFVLAPASVLGLVASAAPARADDLDVGVFFGGSSGGHGGSRGFFGIDLRRSFEVGRARVQRQPRVVPAPYAPAAYPPVAYPPVAYPPVAYPPVAYPPVAHPAPHLGRQVFIPAHEVCRSEVVCEPAVYEDRCVPVYDTVEVPVYDVVCVPVYEEVCVPVFDERRVPVYDRVVHPRTGKVKQVVVGERLERVQVGERHEQRQVGERKERVVVGSRTERVQVGERTERVLVRAETKRVVERKERVPGRFVTVVDASVRPGTVPGEVMTRAEFEAEMALVERSEHDGRPADGPFVGGPASRPGDAAVPRRSPTGSRGRDEDGRGLPEPAPAVSMEGSGRPGSHGGTRCGSKGGVPDGGRGAGVDVRARVGRRQTRPVPPLRPREPPRRRSAVRAAVGPPRSPRP